MLLTRPARPAARPTLRGRVVVARDVPEDVRSEILATGAEPVWVAPRIDPGLSVPVGVSPGRLDSALAAAPGARNAYVMSPSFVGVHADLPGLRRVAATHRVRLLVDDRWAVGSGLPHTPGAAVARSVRAMLARLPGVHVVSAADLALSVDRVVLRRIVLDVRGRDIPGQDLVPVLHAAGVDAEVLDADRVVVTIGATASPATARRVVLAVASAGHWRGHGRRRGTDPLAHLPEPGPTLLSAQRLARAATEAVTLRAAVGRVCAEAVVVAPPALPLALPGELLTCETVAWLLEASACGALVHGTADPTLATVRVVRGAVGGVVDLRARAGQTGSSNESITIDARIPTDS